MRASGAIRVVGLLLAMLPAACAPRVEPPADPTPVRLPAPPARSVSGPAPAPASNPDLVKVFASRGLDAREGGEGVVIYLPTVYLFAFGESDVEGAARAQLQEIAGLLAEPRLAGRRIVVEGHADGVGSRRYNQRLSEARARSVIAALEAGGVPRARLRSRAFGKDRPIEPNRRPDGTDNPDGRARNRRVALVIENP